MAAVEAAIALPLLVLLVFGAMELANGIFLNQSLSIAAYEGARAVCRSGASSAHGESRVAEILSARNIEDYSVSISPNVTSNTPRGTELRVTVTATAPSRGLGPLRLLAGRSFSKRVIMVRL